jgi:hypothetical protein
MAWYDPAFSYKKSIVLPHAKVSGGSDLLDFPVLISLTDSNLKSMANGGLVFSSSGYDLLFTESSETRELPYEVESYTASSGALVCWVRVPVLSASQDTVLYLYFGNSTVTGPQATASNVWTPNYRGVWHLGNGTTLSCADSTSFANNGTNHSATATTGKIDGGAALASASSEFIQIPASSSLNNPGTQVTVSGWGKTTGTSMAIFASGNNSSSGYQIGFENTGVPFLWSSSNGADVDGSTTINDGNWHYVVGVWDGTNATLYADGVQVAQAARTFTASTIDCQIGAICTGANSTSCQWYLNGSVDEVRVFAGTRSASWIATEYTNQSAPSSFFWVGELIPYTANVDDAVLVVSSQATTQTSADQINAGAKGVALTLNIATCGSGETFTLTVQGKDGTSGGYYNLASFSGLGLGSSTCTVYPGLSPSATTASQVLPKTWRVYVTPGTSDSATYSVGASLIA